jgi:hypothetical protein
MATNIKIKTIAKNSKIKIFPWKWIFTGSKTCCTILRPFQFFFSIFAVSMATAAKLEKSTLKGTTSHGI